MELDDIIMEGDPYFLSKYRSFHNHELDTNMIENQCFIRDEDLQCKGSINLLPQGEVAMQELTAKRRIEIIEEGSIDKYKAPFRQVGAT